MPPRIDMPGGFHFPPMNTQVQELHIAADLSNLAAIAHFAAECCQRWNIDARAAFRIQIAIDEAATNVIEHAYEGDGGALHILCRVENGDFFVEMHDQGRHFDPDAVPAAIVTGPLVDRKMGGLGLYFMRKVMDEVHFRFDEKGNHLLMILRGVTA